MAAPEPTRDAVRFLLDGETVELRDVDPTRTVLQWLREDAGRTGTKEGCAEGDCGACTVVLAGLDGNGERLRYRSVNACIQFLPTLDGQELITVESLGSPQTGLHPVQQAMYECHGSQCGFCTPGFVMSLFALYRNRRDPSRREIDDALAGNLCRCTGYRPIVEAARRMYDYESDLPADGDTRAGLRSLADDPAGAGMLALEHDGRRYYAPTTASGLAALLAEYPDACLLAGGTDVGLWVTKQHRELDTVIYVGRVRELAEVSADGEWLSIGAAVTLTDAMPPLVDEYPELEELFLRFASPPIRNTGTLAGNVANGSPIGDSMPALIALGARVVLASRDDRRELALEDFYHDYRKTDLVPGEFVAAVRIPRRRPGRLVAAYKVSKRFDQDISAVCAAFALDIEDGRVACARIACGGMAAIPKRAAAAEQALVGEAWDGAAVERAMAAMDTDFAPITDMRAGDAYRRDVAKNLLRRFHIESTAAGITTRLYAHGRDTHGR
ncbi:xanthine dehydrogenase small subunit [Lentisalinibacter salinarum]|uniref:xanthine dehydrogenase small subunit n=1 Tax=Lentisalinibacter salinarum TaxID=2992239 RepID=UPI003870C3FC